MCSATAAPPFMLPCTQDACRPAALLGYPDGHQGALKAHLVTSTMQGALLRLSMPRAGAAALPGYFDGRRGHGRGRARS